MAIFYWVGGSGTWDNSNNTNWSASSGGAGGSGPPTSSDTVNFDSGSGTAAVVTVTATAAASIVNINKADITLDLSGSPTFTNTTTLTQGTVTLNSSSLTTLAFVTSNSNARTINFGTGRIIVTGNAANVWNSITSTNLVINGSGIVEANYSGAAGTRNLFQTATISNSVSFYVTAGTDTVNVTTTATDVDFTGFSGTLAAATRTIFGNLTLSTGMTLTAATNPTTFGATSGVKTITSNGKTMDFPLTFNGVGGAWAPQDSLTVGSTRTVTLTNGTLDGNSNNISLGLFALGSGTKTLTLGSGTWTVTGSGASAWNANTNVTNLTVSASTGTISMTSASAKTFSGGGRTWPTLNQGGAGALTIAQSNTFTNITNTYAATGATTITFTAGTTQTVSQFTASGASGNVLTLQSSSAGSQFTLSDSSGYNSVSYCSIKDSVATGGAVWQAFTSNGNVNGGNNTGWDFSAPDVVSYTAPIELRSFTERRGFN